MNTENFTADRDSVFRLIAQFKSNSVLKFSLYDEDKTDVLDLIMEELESYDGGINSYYKIDINTEKLYELSKKFINIYTYKIFSLVNNDPYLIQNGQIKINH